MVAPFSVKVRIQMGDSVIYEKKDIRCPKLDFPY